MAITVCAYIHWEPGKYNQSPGLSLDIQQIVNTTLHFYSIQDQDISERNSGSTLWALYSRCRVPGQLISRVPKLSFPYTLGS